MRMHGSIIPMAILMLLTAIPAVGSQAVESTNRDNISLGGTEIIEDAADARIIGQSYWGEGGALGTYSWIGDLNGDDVPDLAVAAPRSAGAGGMKEDGKVFIFYGKGSYLDGLTDLVNVEPDITIWGNVSKNHQPGGNRMGLCLVSAIRAGDFDGDGDDDLALCAPTNNLSGLCYIIYKDSDQWPNDIKVKMDDLFLYHRFFSNTQYAVIHNGSFVTSSEGPMFCTIVYGCGGYSNPMDDQVCDFFHVKDIDRDGIDDIIWGGMAGWTYHGSYQANRGNLRILWGRHPDHYDTTFKRMLPTYNLTCLDDQTGFYRYGMSMDIGDIDGDGWTDAAVGSPWATNNVTGLQETGAVYVYFNLSRLKISVVNDTRGDDGVLTHNGSAWTCIYGSGEGDELGKAVLLRDIDGDGRDDVVSSAPYSDGPGRTNSDCGEIYVFKGRSQLGFPKLMDAESDLDMMLVGPSGASDRKGTGFRLGEMFDIGDVTGDGRLDMVIAVKGLDLPMLDNIIRYNAGAILFYDHITVFPSNSRIVQVYYPSGLFTLEGRDIEDVLGYHLEMGDLDGDGVDDVVVGAPNADGPDNDRTRAGEVYVIYSSSLHLSGLTLSGPGYGQGSVFASGGNVRFDVALNDPRSASNLTSAEFSIGPEDDRIEVEVAPIGVLSYSAPKGYIESIDGGLEMQPGSTSGKAWIDIEFGWAYPHRSGNDLFVRACDADGSVVHRTFREVFLFEKDITFKGDGISFVNGEPHPAPGVWTGIGDSIEIGKISVVYTDRPDREVSPGDVMIDVIDGTEVRSIPYSSDWAFDDVIDTPPLQEYWISMRLTEGMPGDPALWPVIGPDRIIDFMVDALPPDKPYPISLTGSGAGGSGKAGDWKLKVGSGFGRGPDSNGSGIKEYLIENDDGLEPLRVTGALLGTYYTDLSMDEVGLQIPDEGVNFNWDVWGPYPELHVLPPSSFSARWHGWIEVKDSGPYRFQLRGRGMGTMILDGKVAIQLDDLEYSPESDLVTLEPDVLHSVVLYYLHTNDSVTPSFRFWWFDDKGGLVPVPYTVMRCPTNETMIYFGDDTDPVRKVLARDWVGLISPEGEAGALLDTLPPEIDLAGIPLWTNRTKPTISVNARDGSGSYVSGLDPETISYRILRHNESYGTWVQDGIALTDASANSMRAAFSPELGKDFVGTIEIEAADRVGNVFRSVKAPIGVDVLAPSAEVLYPEPGSTVVRSTFNAKVSLWDTGGSGIDASSVRYRIGTEGDWGPWTDPISSVGSDGYLEHELMLSEGNYSLQYSLMDKAGNHRIAPVLEFSVDLPPEDRPPVAVIRSPKNGTMIDEGWPILLSAEGTTDDGLGLYDPVKMTWTSNVSGYLGSGVRVKVYLPAGVHMITLQADDGTPGHNVSASVVVTVVKVKPSEGSPDETIGSSLDILGAVLILVFCLVVTAGLVTIALKAYGKSRSKEARIEVRPEVTKK